jgi:VWFA-related protein
VRSAVLPLVFSVTLISSSTATPQSAQQPGPPTFRVGVDLLTVEATVVDGDGRPVRDLQPADFAARVDDKPRKVLFARFSGSEVSSMGQASATTPVPGQPATNRAAAPGRIVVFVVDRDSIKTGNEKALLETAGTVLDTLTPADAVGLLGLPVGGVEITREHNRVREALSMMTGTRPSQVLFEDRNVSWDEALAYERNDTRAIAEVVARECADIRRDGGLVTQCPLQLRNQARELILTGRAQVQTNLSVLDGLADRLAPLRGPKHVILISGGMPFGQDLLPLFDTFARKAAEAQIVLYAVHLDQHASDAGDRKIVASAFGGREMTQGLTAMTGMTGGAFFSGIGRAAGVFDRIKLELNNFYELGIETAPEDADGKPRAIALTVGRPGLTVRTRRQIALQPASVRAARASDPLAALLQQPTDVSELAIAVTPYTTRGDDEKTLRVLLAAEIGSPTARAPAEWGFVVLNEGNAVASGRHRVEQGSAGPWTLTTSARLAPGRYRLRLVATDADGTRGAIDTPLTVGLRAAGELQLSDLIVGVAEGSRLLPRTRIGRGTSLSALIEIMSADPARLANTRAAIEIVPAGTSEPVQRFLMAARGGGSETLLLNEADIDTARLAPGRYTASVVALVDNVPVGRVSRVFDVVDATSR